MLTVVRAVAVLEGLPQGSLVHKSGRSCDRAGTSVFDRVVEVEPVQPEPAERNADAARTARVPSPFRLAHGAIQ